jgi:hypothetical protein
VSELRRKIVDEILDGEGPHLPDWFIIGVRCAIEDYPFVNLEERDIPTDPAESLSKLGEIVERERDWDYVGHLRRANKTPYIDCGDTNLHRPHASGRELQQILKEHGEDCGLRMKSACGQWGKITLDDSMPFCGDCFGRFG